MMVDAAASQAKSYQRKKQAVSLINLALTPLFLLLIAGLPVSAWIRNTALAITSQAYLALAIYFTVFSIIMLCLDFPLSIYSGHFLEQEYQLSNQNFSGWLGMFFKKAILGFVLSLGLIEGLYALIYNFPDRWWILAWAGYVTVSYVIGKIFPVFIIPIFYKYGDVENQKLKERILSLAAKFKLPVKNVYSLNLSKTTKKANAAFMGLGKTKRVVLSDTLIEQFNDDEIEAVVAHELGHYRNRDILKQLAFGMLSSFVLFWVAFHMMDPLCHRFGYEGVKDMGGLPVLFLLFFAFGLILMPLQNAFSRFIERKADVFALDHGPGKDAFISCMEKLAKVNLADPEPHPLYEWFFYDHPSVFRRIEMARRR